MATRRYRCKNETASLKHSSSAVVYSARKKNNVGCIITEEQLVENAAIQLFDLSQYSNTLKVIGQEAKDRYISKLVNCPCTIGSTFWSSGPEI
ncbi:hypothetical protein OUZ56_012373 [Daphnia magna]|uniref:Uncharacterized protein n=1 Tax=Daphnia magna TaxID=35525 RepID=A0ABQ9Z2U6_9CRUS|nr:hypothetical protein OUZ56_012373 [Daphnia magna]